MIGPESDWRGGEPAGRWDVSFVAKLAAKLKSWLGLGLGVAEAGRDEVQSPTMKVVSLREPVGMRKAA